VIGLAIALSSAFIIQLVLKTDNTQKASIAVNGLNTFSVIVLSVWFILIVGAIVILPSLLSQY